MVGNETGKVDVIHRSVGRQATLIGLVDESKESGMGERLTETFITPSRHVGASCYAILAICVFLFVVRALWFIFILFPPHEKRVCVGGMPRQTFFSSFLFSPVLQTTSGNGYRVK